MHQMGKVQVPHCLLIHDVRDEIYRFKRFFKHFCSKISLKMHCPSPKPKTAKPASNKIYSTFHTDLAGNKAVTREALMHSMGPFSF